MNKIKKCYFCNVNKAEYKTDDNYCLCSFCYLKIVRTCSQCGKNVVAIFKNRIGECFCDDCAKDKSTYYLLKALGRLGNCEKN